MLKSIKSNNSPGHLHNGHSSVVGLSFDSCPGNISKEDNKMKNHKYKRNYIISKMKEMGFSARETFYFMKEHGLDKSYEIIEWCFSSCVKCGKS